MLRYRILSSSIMVLVLGGLLYLDDDLGRIDLSGTPLQNLLNREHLPAGLPMLGIFVVLVVLAAGEMCSIIRATGIKTDRGIIAIGAAVSCIAIYLFPTGGTPQTAIAGGMAWLIVLYVLLLIRSSWGGRTEGAIAAGGAGLACIVYLAAGPVLFLEIRRIHGPWVVAGIILITKMCDVGAYFTGRAVGKHKLIPWLSPGKTWEGLLGGVFTSGVVCLLVVAGANHYQLTGWWVEEGGAWGFEPHAYPLWFAAIAGILLGLVGQLGDLMVSLFKRDAGIKDSGATIPGFGGVLDVIDSPILAAVLGYWLLFVAVRIV